MASKKLLNAMRVKSQLIWQQSLSLHESEIDEIFYSVEIIYEWKKVLENKNPVMILLNESVFDLFGAVNSALNGYYRQGMFSLRSFVEMILGLLYYYDHPIEYKMWQSGSGSLNESKPMKWINEDGFLGNNYIDLFIPHEQIKIKLVEELKKLYKNLSKFIHGQKETSMQFSKTSLKISYNKIRFQESKEYFITAIQLANILLIIRFYQEFNKSGVLKVKVPKLFTNFNEVVEI